MNHNHARHNPVVPLSAHGADIDDEVVRALRFPPVTAESRKPRIRRVNLGELQTAFNAGPLRFDVAPVDRGARIAARQIYAHLGWIAEDAFTIELGRTYLVVRRNRVGRATMDSRLRLQLQWTALRYCGIEAGQQALLIAATHQDILVVHPMANLAHMARTFHTEQLEGRSSHRERGRDH